MSQRPRRRVGPASRPALSEAQLHTQIGPAFDAVPPPERILVNDPHRATRTAVVLRYLAARWYGGAPIPLTIAGGSHPIPDAAAREQFEAPLREALGGLAGAIQWHRGSDDPEAPALSPEVLGARRLLAIGSVEPHYFAGVTGAHKTATIGVASLAQITRNHRAALEPQAAPLRLRGNPVFDGPAGIAGLLAQVLTRPGVLGDLAVNLLQSGEEIVEAWAGPLADSPEAALRLGRAHCGHDLNGEQLAWVLARVEGVLGSTLYQADKGIKNVEGAVRDDGAIVLDAPCERGLGPDAFLETLRRLRRGEAPGPYRLGDHKALRLSNLFARGVRVIVVSPHLDSELLRELGFHAAPDLDTALRTLPELPAGGSLEIADAGNFVLLP